MLFKFILPTENRVAWSIVSKNKVASVGPQLFYCPQYLIWFILEAHFSLLTLGAMHKNNESTYILHLTHNRMICFDQNKNNCTNVIGNQTKHCILLNENNCCIFQTDNLICQWGGS